MTMDELYQKSASGQKKIALSWEQEYADIRLVRDLGASAAEEGMDGQGLDLLRRTLSLASLTAEARAAYAFADLKRFCGSKIEEIFLTALVARAHTFPRSDSGVHVTGFFLMDWEEWHEDPAGFIESRFLDHFADQKHRHGALMIGAMPQAPVGVYRADFLFLGVIADSDDKADWKVIPLVVECDGHDFHDRTKDQVRRDKQRDRDMLALGYQCMRFAGSEIWRDPMSCLNEAINFLEGQIHSQRIVKGGAQ